MSRAARPNQTAGANARDAWRELLAVAWILVIFALFLRSAVAALG